ncbi:MAG: tetratricopeptide repeat protein, partial [Gemmatimonadales bacterium]
MYGATAFVLLQVADLLAQGMGLSEGILRVTTFLVLIGFPIAIVLAWAFDMTPEGVKRTGEAAAGEIECIVAAPASQRLPAGLMALVGVVALVLGAWWVGTKTGAGPDLAPTGSVPSDVRLAFVDPTVDPRPSIAVLPFADMSPEGDQEYFSDGITEEILNVLAKIRELRVAARTSTFALKDQDLTAAQWGDTLKVGYFVEGSVRKSGDQVRITAQLIDTSDGSHVWSENYDRSLVNIFQIQTEIAEAIAEALTVPLGLEDPARLVNPTTDVDAYDLYLAGRARMRDRSTGLLEAMRLFEAAIARDSLWAPAWASLAEAKEISIWYDETFDEGVWDGEQALTMLAESEEAARRGMALDPRNASALTALGSVQRDRGQWKDSEASYRRAIELAPDNAEAHQQYAEMLNQVGRIAESVRVADRAAALDQALIRIVVLADALRIDDRLPEALEVYRLGLARDADVSLPFLWESAAEANMLAGQTRQAIEMWDRLVSVAFPPLGLATAPTRADMEAYMSGVVSGDLAQIPQDMKKGMWPAHWMMVGVPDSAIAYLTLYSNAAGNRSHPVIDDSSLPWLQNIWLPVFDSIRSDPRIQSLLKTSGLAGVQVSRTPPAERTRPL